MALRRLDLGVRSSPFELHGALALEAGPTVAGQVPVAIDGSFVYRIAGPAGHSASRWRADGQTRIMGLPVATGHVELGRPARSTSESGSRSGFLTWRRAIPVASPSSSAPN